MSSTLFNSASFQCALTFIECLLQKEDNVFNLIDLCHDNSTLSLNLHIILEAIEMEKLLEDDLGCNNHATLNLHTIITTSITAAIPHGILDVIRDSKKFFVPDFIHTCFAGRGIINYFKKFNAHNHSYGTGGKCPTYQPYPKHCPSSSDSSTSPSCGHCLKCKRKGHFHRNCSDYFCQGCYSWGPGHTQPNCPTVKAAKAVEQKEWVSSVTGTTTGESAKELHGSLWTPGQNGHGLGYQSYPMKNGWSHERSFTSPLHPLYPNWFKSLCFVYRSSPTCFGAKVIPDEHKFILESTNPGWILTSLSHRISSFSNLTSQRKASRGFNKLRHTSRPIHIYHAAKTTLASTIPCIVPVTWVGEAGVGHSSSSMFIDSYTSMRIIKQI